jgi:hypothetical protein
MSTTKFKFNAIEVDSKLCITWGYSMVHEINNDNI